MKLRHRESGEIVTARAAETSIASFSVRMPGTEDIDAIAVDLANANPIRWAIRRGGTCWNHQTSNWVYEPMPSRRSDEFLEACRFKSADEALAAARLLALRGLLQTRPGEFEELLESPHDDTPTEDPDAPH